MAFKVRRTSALCAHIDSLFLRYPTKSDNFHIFLIQLVALLALASIVVAHPVDYDSPAEYDFSYSVHDPNTGDIKQQQELRSGGNVQGSYSLVDADGLHRIVDYTADDVNGFQATVRREPIHAPLPLSPAPIVRHVAASSPLVRYAASPAIYSHHGTPASTARIVSSASPAVYTQTSTGPVVFASPAGPAVYASHYSAPAVYASAPIAHYY